MQTNQDFDLIRSSDSIRRGGRSKALSSQDTAIANDEFKLHKISSETLNELGTMKRKFKSDIKNLMNKVQALY